MKVALVHDFLTTFGGAERVLGSIQGLQKGDFRVLDPQAAFNMVNAVGLTNALGLQNLGGIVGRFDAGGFKDLGNQGTFAVVKALQEGDFKLLDKLGAASGACPT